MTEIGLSVIDLPGTVCCSTAERWREKAEEGAAFSIPHLADHDHPRQTTGGFHRLKRVKNGLIWPKMAPKHEECGVE